MAALPSLRHIARGQHDLAGLESPRVRVVLEPHDSGRRVGLKHHLQCPAAVELGELHRVQLSQQPHIAVLCKGQPSGVGLCPEPMGQHLLGGGAPGWASAVHPRSPAY